MGTRFCNNCGAPLQPGKKFCVRCGAPVGGGVAKPSADATAPAPATPATPARQAQGSTYGQPEPGATSAPAPQPRHGLGTGTIVAIAAVAVLAFALVFVVAWSASGNVLPWQAEQAAKEAAAAKAKAKAKEKKEIEAAKREAKREAKEEARREAAKAEAAAAANEAAAAQAQRDAQKKASDEEFKNQILPYYNRLSGYDSRIASCATTFNSTYLSTDYDARADAAEQCYSLQQSIQSDAASFASIQAPEGSSYASQHAAIKRCLSDLEARVACIASAWTTDLGYVDPTDHKEEITKPIEDGKDPSTGKVVALQDYKETYPTIKF